MSKNFDNKACHLVSTTVVYTHIYGIEELRGPLLTQRSGNLRMCGSQTDWNIAQILLFLDNLLIFYRRLV